VKHLDNMTLTDEEERTAKSTSDLLLIIKLVMNKIGVNEEKSKINMQNNVRNQDLKIEGYLREF